MRVVIHKISDAGDSPTTSVINTQRGCIVSQTDYSEYVNKVNSMFLEGEWRCPHSSLFLEGQWWCPYNGFVTDPKGIDLYKSS
jgi:hypothetical protein